MRTSRESLSIGAKLFATAFFVVAFMLGMSNAFAGHAYGPGCNVSTSTVTVMGPYGPEVRWVESVTCRNGYHHYRYSDSHTSTMHRHHRGNYYSNRHDRFHHSSRHQYHRHNPSWFHFCAGAGSRSGHLNICAGN